MISIFVFFLCKWSATFDVCARVRRLIARNQFKSPLSLPSLHYTFTLSKRAPTIGSRIWFTPQLERETMQLFYYTQKELYVGTNKASQTLLRLTGYDNTPQLSLCLCCFRCICGQCFWSTIWGFYRCFPRFNMFCAKYQAFFWLTLLSLAILHSTYVAFVTVFWMSMTLNH